MCGYYTYILTPGPLHASGAGAAGRHRSHVLDSHEVTRVAFEFVQSRVPSLFQTEGVVECTCSKGNRHKPERRGRSSVIPSTLDLIGMPKSLSPGYLSVEAGKSTICGRGERERRGQTDGGRRRAARLRPAKTPCPSMQIAPKTSIDHRQHRRPPCRPGSIGHNDEKDAVAQPFRSSPSCLTLKEGQRYASP